MIDQNKYIHFIEMYIERLTQTFKKEYRNGQELWLKVKIDQDQYKKIIIEINGRVAKFHISSITFWVKDVSQPKNKQKSAAGTQSTAITNLEITSVLAFFNCFYYQANSKLMNFLKFT